MKLNKTSVNVLAVTGLLAALVVGCSTPTIPITMDVSGEIKLTGVNRIALADFNTLPEDPFSGIAAADAETCELVKRSVASAFYVSPMYQISDLDVEKQIAAQTGKSPKRFDAVIYGRLWWQVTPETAGQYPKVYTLESWNNMPYTVKDFLTGKQIVKKAHVTTQMKDVIALLDYRTQSATLMLTLSIYRIDANGKITKIVDTYQVTDRGFTLMNGEMKIDCANVGGKDDNAVTRLQKTGKKEKTSTAYEEMFEQKSLSLEEAGEELKGALTGAFGGFMDAVKDPEPKAEEASKRRVDANGKLLLTQETVSMPTELQAKLILASSISRSLSSKIAPTKATFDVPADLGDSRLENLLMNGAFASAKEYSLYMIQQKLGKQVNEKVAKLLPGLSEVGAYALPESEKVDLPDDDTAKLYEYVASNKLGVYFYAIGICHEALHNPSEAMDYYRFAFNVKPTSESALGISRIYMTLGESAKLKQTKKAKKVK